MQHREVWANPNVHPFDGRAIIPWNDNYLADFSNLLADIEQSTLDDAREQGWTFGRLTGPFAHARAKLEEAQLLQEALGQATPLPNFPVYRALFFGFSSATYAVKEAVRRSCKRIGNEAEAWFEGQFQRLKSDPVVWGFYQLNNANKHEPSDLPLRSYLRQRSVGVSGGPFGVRVVMSNDGILGIVNEGTAQERVVALPGAADVDWEVILEMAEFGLVGPATPFTDLVLRFYEQLVFDARRNFCGEQLSHRIT